MPPKAEVSKLSVREFAQRFRSEMIPLNNRFSYFSAVPLTEDDVAEYLEQPIAALPPAIQSQLTQALVFLVPYIQKTHRKDGEQVTFERPAARSDADCAQFMVNDEAVMVFAIRDRESGDYHFNFYRAIATLTVDRGNPRGPERFYALLRDELRNNVHGEVDEESWKLKTGLMRKQQTVRRDTKMFRVYARQSMIDTLTLYLHGICCDIDIESGPRQIPSRFLRKRLDLLRELYPPPQGYAVFPEELPV